LKKPLTTFIRDIKPRTLIIMCGLPGTFKTGIAMEISKVKKFPVLQTDAIRREVLRNEDIFDEKVASDMSKRELVYYEMFRRAEDLARNSDGLILDATFVTQKLRKIAAKIAAKCDMTLTIIQTRCLDKIAIDRILNRAKAGSPSNAITKQAYLNNKKIFEPVDLNDLKKDHPNLKILHVTVDTNPSKLSEFYITSIMEK